DATAGLWHRDENYDPPFFTPNGLPCFWSRGNGWVFAAHCRVLRELPPTDPHWNEYLTTFQSMAAALAAVQREDGFWNVSLADSLDYPGPESSGTAFFSYGMAWGIRNGHLDAATYTPVVARAWHALATEAVHPDGVFGWVQGPAGQPADSQPVTYESSTDYGTGSFLLAGSEVYQLAAGVTVPPPGSNLAKGQLSDYSAELPDHEAMLAVDDDFASYWATSGYPAWLELDLGETVDLLWLELLPFADRAYQYLVEVKLAPGDTYETLVDRTANTTAGPLLLDIVTPTAARYIRLTVTGAHDYAGSEVEIFDFRIFGSDVVAVDGQNPPPVRESHLTVYPNPANPGTWIEFTPPAGPGPVSLAIFDVRGRRVRTLLDRVQVSTRHGLRWDGRDDGGRRLPSGSYLCRLEVRDFVAVQRLTLVR
ncbi:MAG: glycoside hydrolase family 88 protein, partial [bacterium]